MRLTLRPLLAWLDDMLPVEEVREIGRQVDESPLARELVDRIQRVTRQRRLTAPASSGPDGIDPNIVADYLDGSLPADQVIEFEKKCLTSDVHLAEVASVHQILSLLGQRAQVPIDARHRMYHLVRGPETMPTRSATPAQPSAAPLAAPLPAWQQSPNRRQRHDLVRPLAALAALLLLLVGSAWWNLSPRPAAPTDSGDLVSEPKVNPASPPLAANAPAQKGPTVPEVAQPPNNDGAQAIELNPANGADTPVAEPQNAMAADGAEKQRPGNAAAAVVVEGEGAIVHPPTASEPWERAKLGAAVNPGSLIANLDPFQAKLDLGSVRLVMQRGTTIEVGRPAGDQPPPLNLLEGELVITSDQPGAALELAALEPLVRLQFDPDVRVGAKVLRPWTPGMLEPPSPGLTLYVAQGEALITVGDTRQTVRGPAAVSVGRDGKTDVKPIDAAPEWVTQPTVAPVDAELGGQLARYFRDTQIPVGSLAEATSSDQPELRVLAFEGLGQLNNLSLVIQTLNAGNDPGSRRAAIAALRKVMARGEPWLSNLRKELAHLGDGEAWAKMVEGLLVGFPAGEKPAPEVRDRLIEWLKHPDPGVRELALENLMRITGRADALGYDPDKPTDAAVEEWRSLLTPRGR